MPSKKVSTDHPSAPHRSQKHQNVFAFRHNKNSKLTQKILSSPIYGLCTKCTEIIEWKKRYRKYKPLTTPRRCNRCQQKNITAAYHTVCDACARQAKICAKCEELKADDGTTTALKRTPEEESKLLASMSERQRRSYLRHQIRKVSSGMPDLSELSSEDDGDDLSGASELESEGQIEVEGEEELEESPSSGDC